MMDVTVFFPQIRTTSEGFAANCPRCDDKSKAFHFNIEKGVGCCHHSGCPWFRERGGVTAQRLAAYFSAAGVIAAIPEVIESSAEAEVKIPKEFRLVEDLDDDLKRNILSYLDMRGIPKRLVRRARIGYCEKGKFWGYLIFPVFEDGEVMWWQGRRYKDRTPKFWNPESTQKAGLLYRVGPAKRPKTLVIVESIINALTLETSEPTKTLVVGLMTNHMTEIQRDKILMYERWAREVIVALDGDAIREATAIADELVDRLPAVKIAMIPDGKDINELGRAESWRLIRSALVYRRNQRMLFATREIEHAAH